PGQGDLGLLDQLVGVLEVQLRVGPHRLEDVPEVVGADDLRPERAVLVGELGDLGQPDLVDLLGRLVGGREVAARCRVRLAAAVRVRSASSWRYAPTDSSLAGIWPATVSSGTESRPRTSASWRWGPLTGLAVSPVRGVAVTSAVVVADAISTSRVSRWSSSS